MNEIRLTLCLAGKATPLPPVPLAPGFVFAGACQWGDGFIIATQPDLSEREEALANARTALDARLKNLETSTPAKGESP